MDFLLNTLPALIVGVVLIFIGLRLLANHRKQQENIVNARVLKTTCRFEPGIYHSRAMAYDLTLEYPENGCLIQKIVPHMEHFPENSIVKVLPKHNRVIILTRTPGGPITDFRFDIVTLCIGLFIVLAGFVGGLSTLFPYQWMVDMSNAIPTTGLACCISCLAAKKKKELLKYTQSLNIAKVEAVVKEHRLERREKGDIMHNILSYEYNQLLYLYDHKTSPHEKMRMYSYVPLNVDAKTGYVLRQDLMNFAEKSLYYIALGLWISSAYIVLSTICNSFLG